MATAAASQATDQLPDEESVAARVRIEVERTLQRSIKGLEYISTGDPAVGLTPRDLLYQRGTMKLYHYRPLADEIYRVPLLLVMSLVSKPYILDLVPGQSLIEFLMKRGYDVYMIDWGIPRSEDKRLRIEDYVLDFIPECIDKTLADCGEDEVSLVGYCMGGLLATLYCATREDEPSRVKNLACFTTPVNFDGMRLFKRWTDRRHFDVDRIVDTMGNVPPELLFASFEMLRPIGRVVGQVRLWDNMWNDEFTRSYRMFDRWAGDQIPFPGECFRQFIKDLQWENKLVKGEYTVGGRKADLQAVKQPFIHIVAEHDHIVPYESAKDLVNLVGSEDRKEVMLKGGHVSLVAGGNAMFRLWPQLDTWLSVRSV